LLELVARLQVVYLRRLPRPQALFLFQLLGTRLTRQIQEFQNHLQTLLHRHLIQQVLRHPLVRRQLELLAALSN
jgi:hypothetical protein